MRVCLDLVVADPQLIEEMAPRGGRRLSPCAALGGRRGAGWGKPPGRSGIEAQVHTSLMQRRDVVGRDRDASSLGADDDPNEDVLRSENLLYPADQHTIGAEDRHALLENLVGDRQAGVHRQRLARRVCAPRYKSGDRDKEQLMTGKADFTQQEWETVLGGPPSAGAIVMMAQRGGTFRETFAIGKAYAEAREQHGDSELLDEIVSAKPEVDHTRYKSVEELEQHGLQHLHDAIELLARKATPDEVEGYRRFVLTLAEKVANAHREHGVAVSEAERAAIDEIANSVGAAGQ